MSDETEVVEGWLMLVLDAQSEGERLDKALVRSLESAGQPLSRSRLRGVFDAGDVQGQGQVLAPKDRAQAGMRIRLRLPTAEPLQDAFPEAIALSLLYEDEHLLVIDKAPGMVVHAGVGHASGTLVNAVLHHLGREGGDLPVLPGNDATRPGIVHRLDRDTSGVMVVACSQAGQDGLAEQFRAHSIDREYLGLAWGRPGWTKKTLKTFHGRDPKHRKRFSARVERGRLAITHIEVEQCYPLATAMRFRLETGRTHQIRVHARHLGHPLLADELYGPVARSHSSRYAQLSQVIGRQALHAELLGFAHPVSGEQLRFRAEPPEDFRRLERVLQEAEGS